jgi:hypothetical protein
MLRNDRVHAFPEPYCPLGMDEPARASEASRILKYTLRPAAERKFLKSTIYCTVTLTAVECEVEPDFAFTVIS